MRWQTTAAESDAYWLMGEALASDYATSMLTEETRKSLAGFIANWLTADDAHPTAADVTKNLPTALIATALAAFGPAFIQHVANLTVNATMPSASERG